MNLRLESFYGKANYQLQYVDYFQDTWTVPVLLTKERAEKFCSDFSVRKIKLTSNSFAPLIPGKAYIKEIELDVI